MTKKILIAIATAAMTVMLSDEGRTRDTGTLMLYNGSSEGRVAATLKAGTPPACTTWRKGHIVGQRGPLDMGSFNKFIILQCAAQTVGGQDAGTTLAQTLTEKLPAWAITGTFTRRDEISASHGAMSGRQYVLKISQIRPDSRDGFEKAHAEFMQSALGRPSAFRYEAALTVEHAGERNQPDMVEIFYYDTPADQQEFLAKNPDIREWSRIFNTEYMTTYSYMAASIVPEEN